MYSIKVILSTFLYKWEANELLSLFSFACLIGWIISFPYEGPVMYGFLENYPELSSKINRFNLLFLAAGIFTPLFFSASYTIVRRWLLALMSLCFLVSMLITMVPKNSVVFFFPFISYVAGISLTLNSHQLKNNIRKRNIKSLAPVAMLVACCILIVASILVTMSSGLSAIVFLQSVFLLSILLLAKTSSLQKINGKKEVHSLRFILRKFWLLLLFIFLITINAGIMFQTIYPAFAEFKLLSSFYTNLPYMGAVFFFAFIAKGNKFNMLYFGLALWGVALILFSNVEVSAMSFFVIISCALFASGIFDYFWWSIFTTSFDYVKNPATMFSLILFVNIMGTFTGGFVSNLFQQKGIQPGLITQMGLMVVIIGMVCIVPINRMISGLLSDNEFIEKQHWNHIDDIHATAKENLSSREQDVFSLLLLGKSDKEVAADLNIALNTVKSHNRKIYNKLEVKNRIELKKHFGNS